jgi:FkbM family methyltransferase
MPLYTFQTPWGISKTVEARADRSDYNTLNSCLKEDEYHLKALGVPGQLFIDIGAHIGGATIAAVARGMNTISVEVLPENVEMIGKNLLLSGLSTDKRVEHAAIHHTTGETMYAIYGDQETESGFHHEFIGFTSSKPLDNVDPARIREVKSISLPDLFEKYEVDHCRILKIDCEGAEWQCFKDVPEDVLDRIDYIIGEVHPDTTAPTERSPAAFLDLLKGRFIDVSTKFNEIGFKKAVETKQFCFNFVLENTRVQIEEWDALDLPMDGELPTIKNFPVA